MVNTTGTAWEMTIASTITYDYQDYYDYQQNEHAPCTYQGHGNRFLPVLYSLCFVVGFLGNGMVVWVLMVGVGLKSVTDVCLLNLALADLLLVLSLPFLAHYASHSWIFGRAVCRLVLSMYYIGFYAGIFFIVFMSVDRYLAVVHALRVQNRTYGIVASVVIWIMAVASSFPELCYVDIEETSSEVLCSAYLNNKRDHYLTTVGLFKMNILSLLLPLSIVGFCYSMVLRRLLTVHPTKKLSVRLVIMVTVVFFCCWAPYNIAAFLKALGLMDVIPTDCKTSQTIQVTLQATEAVAYLQSCLNPFIYAFVGKKFKKHLARLLQRTPLRHLLFMKHCLARAVDSVSSPNSRVVEGSTAV